MYDGTIVMVWADGKGGAFYHVRYDDGDEEDLSKDEVDRIRVYEPSSAAAPAPTTHAAAPAQPGASRSGATNTSSPAIIPAARGPPGLPLPQSQKFAIGTQVRAPWKNNAYGRGLWNAVLIGWNEPDNTYVVRYDDVERSTWNRCPAKKLVVTGGPASPGMADVLEI